MASTSCICGVDMAIRMTKKMAVELNKKHIRSLIEAHVILDYMIKENNDELGRSVHNAGWIQLQGENL